MQIPFAQFSKLFLADCDKNEERKPKFGMVLVNAFHSDQDLLPASGAKACILLDPERGFECVDGAGNHIRVIL